MIALIFSLPTLFRYFRDLFSWVGLNPAAVRGDSPNLRLKKALLYTVEQNIESKLYTKFLILPGCLYLVKILLYQQVWLELGVSIVAKRYFSPLLVLLMVKGQILALDQDQDDGQPVAESGGSGAKQNRTQAHHCGPSRDRVNVIP